MSADDIVSLNKKVKGGRQYVELRDSSGSEITELPTSAEGNIGTTASATQIGYTALVIRDETLGTLSDADGDLVGLRVDSTGRLWVNADTATIDNTAAAGVNVVDANIIPLGFVTSNTISTAKSLATLSGGSIPAGSTTALVQALTRNVRWRDDGTSPNTTTGVQLAAGDQFYYTGDLTAIEFIEETSTAVLNISFYKQS